MRYFKASWLVAVWLSPFMAFAQFDGDGASGVGGVDEGTKEIEALYDKIDVDQKQKDQAQRQRDKEKSSAKELNTLSELSVLAPFSDVAVIQRRFLPRTGRFEFTGSGITSINNPFFNNFGLSLRGAYFLTEKHGLEAHYFILTNTNRDVTDNLSQKRNVKTSSLVKPSSYIGGAYKWTPIYGKITFLNQKIVPFDLYFTTGLGLTQTQKQGEPTLHLGTGQVFALSKSLAIRWDMIWNFYQAQVDAPAGGTSTSGHNDLMLGIGVSFFFPEATYR